MDAQEIALAFNAAITDRNIGRLAELMHEDHLFIDSAGNPFGGKAVVLAAWTGFFEAFPDYQNHFEHIETHGDDVVIAGYSSCSDVRLSGPALWKVSVNGQRATLWQVFDDNEGNRQSLGLPPKGD